MKTIEEKAILICDSHHGVHIPQIVAENFAPIGFSFGGSSQCTGHLDGYRRFTFDWSDVPRESVETLLSTPRYTNSGYYEESYWESWEDVLNNLKIEIDGETYHMIQNEDVWLIPDECMDELEEWII